MTETLLFVSLAQGVVVFALILLLVFRKPKFETPADLSARVGLLEQASHGLVQAV